MSPQKKVSLAILFFCISYLINQQQDLLTEKRIAFYANNTINVVAKIVDINKNDQTSLFTITLKIKRLKTKTTLWHNVDDTILLYTRNFRYFSVDDTIYAKEITCSKIRDNKQKDFLKRNQYHATAFYINKFKKIKRPQLSFRRIIHNIKNNIRNSIKKKLPFDHFNLFSSIFLGKRESENFHLIKKPFMAWGITHYLARSGLHLAIIFVVISSLLNFLFIPIALKTILIFLFCIFYAFFSWHSISFTRSLLLISGYQLCTLLKIPINSIHLLNIVLLICIHANTQLPFSLDFQLTFLLTYSLILINKYKLLSLGPSKSLHKKELIS